MSSEYFKDVYYFKYLAKPHNNIHNNTKHMQQVTDLQSYICSLIHKNLSVSNVEHLLGTIKNELIIIDVLDSIIDKI